MNEPASHCDRSPLASNAEDQSLISPNKAKEPTSIQNLPRIPSDQGSLPSLPFHVAIADGGLEIDARIKNEADVDKLIQILQTIKPLLQSIYGRQPSVLTDPPDPPDTESRAQRAFDVRDDAARRPGNRDVVLYYKGPESRTATAWLQRGTDSRDEARRRAQGARIDWMIRGKLILRPGKSPLNSSDRFTMREWVRNGSGSRS